VTPAATSVATPGSIAAALAGVRGFVLDADGVILSRGEALPGARDALRRLAERRIPFRIVTNFSSLHRESLAARYGGGVPADRFITAASAAATYTATAYPGRLLFVLSSPDAIREFDGQVVLGPADAATADAAPPGEVAAVVIGDGGDDLSFANLDVAFRLIRRGAELLAMHRNPWWLTPKGETLDAGAIVAGLEFATGRPAHVLGKPSPDVFRQAVAGLASDLGVVRLPAHDVAMVGDDPDADVAAAKSVGLRGILVLTGKTTAAEAEAALRRGARRRPDAVAASLAEVVAAID
jgi:HAD superfamily hydrolase (TIGR01450 family)